MHTVDIEDGVGLLSGPLGVNLRREEGVGLLSDWSWREWASTNQAPWGRDGGSLASGKKSSLWGQKCDERSTSSPKNATHSLPLTSRKEKQ